METSSIETLEIYIDYDRLKAKDLANCLINLSEIANKIAEDYFSRFNDYEDEELPTLDVDSFDTGNSIKFRLKEGWKPKVSSNSKGDIVVEIPKTLGIPIMVGYLLIAFANGYQDFRNKQLDNELKKIEIQLKQAELVKVITTNNEDRQNFNRQTTAYIENKVPEIKPILYDTVKSILRNPDITQFKINNIEIKRAGNERNQ